jgi:hypothetical protein
MTKLGIQNVRLGGSCFHTLLDLGMCEEPGMAREAILSGKTVLPGSVSKA